jgi:FAD/FMN-containing dehydrogenase
MIDINRPESTEEVAIGVRVAKRLKLDISVRSGGHSYTCQSIKDGAIHFDLRELNRVQKVGKGQVSK